MAPRDYEEVEKLFLGGERVANMLSYHLSFKSDDEI